MIDIDPACLLVEERQTQRRQKAVRPRLEPSWSDTQGGALRALAHPLIDVYQAMLLLDRRAPG